MREQWPTWIGSAWSIKTAEAGDSRRRVPPARAGRQREDRGGVGRLSQREEETLRVAVRADVHKTAPEHLLDPGAVARLQGQAEWWDGECVDRNPRQARGGLWVVCWAPGTLWSKRPPVRPRTQASL